MNSELHVFVLAAGLGTRLHPLTLQMPKPLVPVVDQTILAHVTALLRKLQNQMSVSSLHVNAHYLSEMLQAEALRLKYDQVWVETPDILGTGGPLERFARQGPPGELLVVNSDNLMDLDLASFVRESRRSGKDWALLCRHHPQVNTVCLNEDYEVIGLKGRYGCVDSPALSATFSGVSWYSFEALQRIESNDQDIRTFWAREYSQGRKPFAYMGNPDQTWIDMGSPQGLFQAGKARLEQMGLSCYQHPSVRALDLHLGPGAIVSQGAWVGANSYLEHCMVLPGAVVSTGARLSSCIVGKDFCWEIS